MTLPHAPLHILVSPLDWGLGHTSRCVPIIAQLLARGCRVTAAGTEWQQSFYHQTFPEETASGLLQLRNLAGYNVRYAKTGEGFLPRMARQLPRLLRTVRVEHRWLSDLVKREKIDGIISDNRYGLYQEGIPSVILTHQLSPRTGMGAAVDSLLRRIHYHALEKFGACWVVDIAKSPGLSGSLAHPPALPKNAQYIGLLSQFADKSQQTRSDDLQKGPLLVLLSGPEPQRTLLSQRLWAQVQQYNGEVAFVEGREDAPLPDTVPPHITHHRRLTSSVLRPLLQRASAVVCRSGYSTLMDLVAMGKRAIIIPTPGQTEQEYLARTLAAGGLFATARQENFSLPTALAQLNTVAQSSNDFSGEDFQRFYAVVDNWLATL